MRNGVRKAGSSVVLSPEQDTLTCPPGCRPTRWDMGSTSARGNRVLKACSSGVS